MKDVMVQIQESKITIPLKELVVIEEKLNTLRFLILQSAAAIAESRRREQIIEDDIDKTMEILVSKGVVPKILRGELVREC